MSCNNSSPLCTLGNNWWWIILLIIVVVLWGGSGSCNTCNPCRDSGCGC